MRFSGKRWLSGALAAVLMLQQLVPMTALAEDLSSGEEAVYAEDTAYSVMSSEEDITDDQDLPELEEADLVDPDEEYPDEEYPDEEYPDEDIVLSDGSDGSAWEEGDEYPGTPSEEDGTQDPDAEDMDESGSIDEEAFDEEDEELEEDDEDLLLSSAPLVGSTLNGVFYINADGDPATAPSCTRVEEDVTAWKNGWYVVEGDVTIDTRVKVTKDVSLILADGAKLTVPMGIEVNGTSTNALHIYAQEEGTGALVSGGSCAKGAAGIGGKSGMLSGPISIHGGTITARGGLRGAGIGGGLYSDATDMMITGGTVTAVGGDQAAGIGGGYQGGCQKLWISKGTITAIAGNSTASASKAAEAIGTGQDPTAGSGTLSFSLYDGAEIRAGSDEDHVEIYFSDDVGVDACRNNPYVRISQATEGIRYIDKDGIEWLLSVNLFKRITADTVTWDQSWYAVTGDITIRDRVLVSGNINLVLGDGARLNASKGITVPEGCSIRIFGQKEQSGRLVAEAGSYSGAGIGSENEKNAGTIELYGGRISAVGGPGAPGIGGARNGSAAVIIGRGEINAAGGSDGAGIGGGADTSVTINGGTVIATGNGGGAGIGGNNYRNGGTVNITDGTVTATGGENGAGIGGGRNGDGGSIEISGGTVEASGSRSGAGIGGGNGGKGASITVRGGSVTASGGGYGGCGIGGGNNGAGGDVTLTGGIVLATGGGSDMAIGGEGMETGTIRFADMRVFAGGSPDTLSPVKVGPGNDIREQECHNVCARIDLCEEHAAAEGYVHNEEGHWNVCANCMTPLNGEYHRYREYADKNKEEKYTFEPVDETWHQRECEVCGYIEKGLHSYDTGDLRCQLCGGGEIVVTYVDANGTKKQHKGCLQIHGKDADGTEVFELNDELFDGFYMVKDDVEIENRMTVDGKVNLVLCDGASLTATKGIEVNSGNTLTIWRQEKGTGKLYARGSSGNAGIGGADDDNGGTIVINGGNIIAIGGENAAGIGAGSFLDDPPTEKVIKGSTYYFLYCNGLGATVTINGGSVDALGGAGGAGIGGGRYCAGGTITITGGTVKARGSAGAGIGGGEKGTGGTITISGGDVSASGDTGAGIGSGHEGSHDRLKKGTVITITNGAKVDAYSSDATAIGLARCYYPVLTLATPCEVNILSGRVKATSRIVFPVGVSLHPAWNPSLSSARLVKITLACNRPSDYIWLNGPTDNDIYTLYYRIPTYRGHKLDIAPGSGYPLADKDTNRVINQLVDGWGYVSCWDLGRTYLVPATVYYVHFDGNGADGFMEDTAADPASEYRLPESGFYPPYGKYFSGWRADVDGSLYQSGEVFTSNVYPKDITFKAEWEDGYGIWVGNRLITPQNAKDVFGDGSVSYDDAAKKLKLSDLSKISVDRGDQTGDQPYKHALIYAEDRDLNIELDDAAVSADELTDYGIRVVNGELHISGAAGGDGTLQVEGAKIGICADEKVVIEDLRRLTVLEQSGNGIGIQSKNASVELRRNNLSAYSAMQYEITGGTGIEGNGVSIQDISLVTAKSTAPKGYGIRSYSWVNLTRTTSYTRIDAHGGTAGVYADNMITQQDSDLRASGDAYGIYTGRGLTLLRRETSVRATAESPGTGIYVGGYLRNEDGIVTSRGGKIGIESDGVYPRWMDTSYTDIKVDASGTVQAIKGPTQIEYAMEIQRPDEASMRSDGIILDKDGRPATDVLIVPREFEISFDPGEGSGTMASLYVTQDAETFLPRCSFTSPEPGLLFAGWKINGKIYGEGDAFTTADDVTAVAQWGFTWWTLQNLLKKGGEIVLPCDVTAGSADTYLSSTRDAVIDLNGHTIDRGLNSIRSDGQVFRVTDGTLTIKDSTGEGRITGGKASGNGGAVLISGGSFILEGGTITGNEAAPEESGKQIYGGAVYVDHGTFTMTGGALSGNKAESAGSAVFVANSDARFVMTGGTVTDNYARYGCAVLPRDGSFEISGSPVITGNRMLQGTKTSDYDLYYLGSYMRRTKPILVTGALDENACINVGTSNFNYPVITSGLPGNGSYKSFVSSNPDYTVYPDENGEAALMTKKTLTFYADVAGSKVFLTQKVFPGEPLSQFLSQLSLEKEGFTAAGWTRQKTDQDAYSYKAAVPGDDAYCVDDLSTMEMPGQDTFFYPVLIRHRVQVHLDLGAIDTNANAQNLNGWENPPVYTDTETPASLAISQYRCFNVELGETIRMNEGMSAITRKGYDLDAWLTRNGTRWNSGWGADPQYCDTDNAGNPFLTKSSEYPYSYYTMTLRPAWKLKKATVRYDIGMGRGMVTTQSTATPYSTVTVIRTKPLPPDNYIFVGWRDKQGNVYKGGDTFVYDGFDKVTVITEGTGNNTIRLSAVYAKIPQGALLFDSGGGTNVDPIQKKPTDGSTSYQVTESEVISKQPTRTGYTFTGWYTTEECTEKVKFPMTITGDDNVTIYAGWEANEYRIELDYGPDAGMAVFMGHYGDPVNIPDPVKMHYRFDGWTPAKPAYMPAYNMRLTARWVPRYYTITFDLGGGSGTSYISAIYGASITAPADPEREGYVFAGWEPDIPSNMPDDNPVITARWMQLQDQPEAPVVKEVRDTSIEVVPEEGQEYAIRPADTAEKTEAYSWQLPDENGRMVFEDLVPSLWYRMVTRRAGDDTKLPSEISESALAKTRKSSQEKPAAPTLQAGLTYIEVVPAIEGQEYAIRTIGTPESTTLNYQKPDGDGRMVFDGLLQDTPYQVVTRVAETDTRYVSPVSDPAEIYTQKTTVESVRITGTQRFRETLTAVVQPEDAQDLAFSWYRTGSGGESEEITDAESRTYALTAEDIGKTITLVVLQTVRGGEDVTVSASSGTIRKGVGPEAPALSAEAEETTIKVTAPVQEDARFEYSLDNKTWQSAVSFANLTPGSTYTVYAREKETETHEAGKTASLRISTKLTTAEVYEIRQNADGSWPEPGDPLAARAVARYQVPEDTDAFTAHGYRFDTYIGTDAGTRACSAGAAIVLPPGTQRLYIYYSRNSYDLIFHADIAGEKVSAVYQVLHGASLEYYAEESILPDGCTFAGWTEKPKTDGEYSWREGMAGTEECVLSDLTVMTMPAGEKHFYPVLIPHRIQVHLDVGAVDANADETNMNGWTNPVTYEDEDTAAVMDKAQYRSFTTNPGEKLRMDGGMNSAARAGYVLDGWYTSGGVQWTADMGTDPEYCDKNEDGEVLLTKHPDRPYSYYTITLTAAWALRWADIVYDTAEGNGDVTGDTPVIPYGRVIVTDQTPVPPKGYGFIGWADKTGHLYKAGQNFAYHNLSRVTALGTGDDNNTITLTAQYAEIPQGSLFFDTQGGTQVEPIHKEAAPGSGSYPVTEEEAVDRVTTREGYTFAGWVTAPGGDRKVTWPVQIGSQDVTIYASWTPNTYTITFESMGGSKIPSITLPYGEKLPAPAPVPERLHYVFEGWKPVLPETMPAYDLTVQAAWTPQKYTISFDTAGGNAIDPIEDIYGARVTPPADPVREGYTFTGWEQEIPAYMPDTDPIIRARWKQNQTAPAAPVVTAVTDTSIEVEAEEGQEYAIERISEEAAGGSGDTDDEDPAQGDPSGTDEEKNWQMPDESGRMIFTDLLPATAYRIVTRRAGSDTKMPSEASRPTVQTTNKSTQEAPGTPALVAGRTDIEVIPVLKGLEYSIDGGTTWQKPDTDGRMVFDGLSEDTEYSVLARRAETETKYASEASPASRIFTAKTLLDVIRVTGLPKYGVTLTTAVTPADAADITYQWYRTDASGDDFPGTAISGATGTTYALTAADIGQIITVRAVQTVRGGEDVTAQDTLAQVIRKADGPASPEVQAESDETTITVTAPAQSGNRYEYSLDGNTWQEEPLFEGLMPGTAYLVHAREKETAEQNAGEPGTARVETKKTIADVYEVFENVDGGFTEPGKPLTDKAEGSYVIPARDAFTVSGYTFGSFEADTSSLVYAREGDEVDLPAGTTKLYIYYRRNVHTLTFYEDITGTAKKTEYQVRTGVTLSDYADESVVPVEATFAGWTDTPRTEGTYDWEEGKEGNEKSVLVDVGSYTMPDADLSFYPVLI
ncbi:MAG: InlB B-repeat-containing protein, partial [Blautia sp.]|nr:InlB B-repeat-containing protein [Blautia sp.]